MKGQVNIFWFRRDLRLEDNAGLYHAQKAGLPVVPIFIFDTNILDRLENKNDRRVAFIHQALIRIQEQLRAAGADILVFHGKPETVFPNLIKRFDIHTVFTNHDYEHYASERDNKIKTLLASQGIGFQTYKDQVIFEKLEVCKDDGNAYTVFTPYSRKWKALLTKESLRPFPSDKQFHTFLSMKNQPMPGLTDIGFNRSDTDFPSPVPDEDLIRHYSERRDIPGIRSTSRLGVHLRFGTISIRMLAAKAQSLSETFLNELIWRDFYHMILWNYPQVNAGKSFKPAYDLIEWRNDPDNFEKWCQGKTGYPIVDAGMRELNATGFMHNRVRMIVASFLCKHLLIDWRWGEAYFAEKLLDFDFAANNGGWQWASGSGCDAAPYFRIFNPYLQTKKFDPNLTYIRQWVPEFEDFSYPRPMVNHETARKRCLEVYSKALKEQMA